MRTRLVRLDRSAGRVALPVALMHMCAQVHMHTGILAHVERWARAHWGLFLNFVLCLISLWSSGLQRRLRLFTLAETVMESQL